MDGLSLLAEARAAGLTILVEGDRLVVRGPQRAEPVAKRLLAHKAKVMAALAGGHPMRPYASPWPDALPGRGRRTVDFFELCAACGTTGTWARYGGVPLCLACAVAEASNPT